jgi:hypothetical protein
LRKTIGDIVGILQKDYPQFHLIQNKPSMFYQNANVFFTRRGSHLYITEQFPLICYSFITLQNDFCSTSNQSNTTKASQILNLPNYIALTPNHRHFTTFNYDTLYACDFNKYITCDISLPLRNINPSTCIFALLPDNKTLIFKQCNFRFLPELTKPDIFEISPTSVLLTNIPEVTIKCPNSTVKAPGCKHCIQNIPCLCTIRTPTITYHPKLVSCQENQQAITRLYPVSLALLQAVFGSEQVKSYLGDTYFKNMVNVSVPDFKLNKHKLNYILASDKIDHLSLIKMVKLN